VNALAVLAGSDNGNEATVIGFLAGKKKSRNNENITDPNYKRCRNPKLKQVYHHK
jgi:hypothetical protein